MAYNNKKVGAICRCHILLFVSKTSSFDSLNSQYLKIFEFIRIDFLCFSNVVFLRNWFSIPQTKCVFLFGNTRATHGRKKKLTWSRNHCLFLGLFTGILAQLTPVMSRGRVCVCLSPPCVLLTVITPWAPQLHSTFPDAIIDGARGLAVHIFWCMINGLPHKKLRYCHFNVNYKNISYYVLFVLIILTCSIKYILPL